MDDQLNLSDNFKKADSEYSMYYEHMNRSNWWRMSNYISPASAEALRGYKYYGGDDGFSYNRCWSPLANSIVNNIVPEWIAPNVVSFQRHALIFFCFQLTLTGFSFTLLPLALAFGPYNMTFENSPETMPRWFYIFFALCYLIYRLFDETDGKQARKTGSSSPLGMLFDHGVDGFAVTYVVMCSMKFLGCGDNSLTLWFFSACITMFYMPILEEYYVGGIFFGACNPITDGAILAFVLYICLAIFGNDIVQVIVFKQDALFKGS